ncbi:MAG: SUMF1/EgtB/PvdO family nonheme iron enzyme [Verrucomicrobia bacterium]|jgi:formylglycine-generating enzyme required for sulfatase activity/photosystem II stability/assembly factor-like uncharacterized protein|nr:SUMF1/EgtB/PvdO family nonheme iron enzyme [Verrucomicrobiota bacterium]MBT7066845.1 SUMF1/EgtB/PvdO family nonheme iron enzyme [Verrucomicrobiota bacterium]MBT7700516.1 SUMF1/EgtB/PvdO family nonheme iron enzyme [Verrucomicrobiota bacterium]
MRFIRRGLWGGIGGSIALGLTVVAAAGDYSWTELQPAGNTNRYWYAASASRDGQTVIAAYDDGRLYTSANNGAAWVERQPAGDADLFWSAVATSGDGQVLLAASAYDFGELGLTSAVVGDEPQGLSLGRLYASPDGGQSWTEQQPAGDTDLWWGDVAVSADGQTMLAGVAGYSFSRLYLRRDGANWQEAQPDGASNYMWRALACSGDGSVLVAGAAGERLHLSRDGGTTWNEIQPAGVQTRWWQCVAISAFGRYIYAGAGGEVDGRLYGSSDFGQSWSELQPAGDQDHEWTGLSCSGSGRRVVAVQAFGRMHISEDAGATWSESQPTGDQNEDWYSATLSADGRHLTASSAWGRLYTGVLTNGLSRLFYEAWDSSGVHQIWSCLEDGSSEIPLFDDGNNRYKPVVSPDGTRLAYILRSGSTSWICTANVNGAYEEFLVSSSTDVGFRSVDWHPDGTHLLYVEGSYNGGVNEPSPARDGHLYRCDTNGANVVELLSTDFDYNKHRAAYAPDGAFIALSRNEATWYAWPQNLFVCDPDGSNLGKITNHGNGEVNKVFTCRYSPSGSRIIYQRGYSNGGNSTLWTIRPDGSNHVNIVDGTFSNEGPTFTPDGRQVVFSRYSGGRWQLARSDRDGSNVQLLPLSAALNRVFPCQAIVKGLPAVVGRIRVNIQPARAAARGGQWQIWSGADTAWHDSDEVSGWLDPADGPYDVFFRFVNDFYTPFGLYESVGGNATTFAEGFYEPTDMAYIGGGTFDMGLYLGQGGHSVTLDDFGLDYREVTVGDFQEFIAATSGTMPTAPPWGWGDTDLPMVNVTWNDAAAFAAWAGKRLPTEAEFEYAMRDGAADQRYPWGDTISASDANYLGAGIGQPTVAESYPNSSHGLYDIAGNVNEWCYDWYEALLSGPVDNPMGPASGTHKTTRSGSWVNRDRQLRCSSRIYREPAVRYIDLGFRCAGEAMAYGQEFGGPAPTWWVLAHFGLEVGGPGGKFVAENDSDGDGMEDGAEFVAGTDPTDRDSLLSIARLTPSADGTGFVIEWSSAAGKLYTLESCSRLGEGYTPVAGNIPATPPMNSYPVHGAEAGAAFYRVRLPQ